MAKILILAESGFGKTSSACNIPELKIQGLNPKETYFISATSKPLPFKKSASIYKVTTLDKLKEGNRVITNNGDTIAQVIKILGTPKSPYNHIVIDDSNYVMQDYYMKNSMRKGYDIFKEIGMSMSKIFDAMETVDPNKNIFMLAHYETFKSDSTEGIGYRFKTVGNQVQNYITPEGKFDIVLFGKQSFDESTQKIRKEFVTNFDGKYQGAKSPAGMFDTYIHNDLGMVAKKIDEYYNN